MLYLPFRFSRAARRISLYSPISSSSVARLELHKELDQRLETTRLPEHPNYARANEFLLHARRHAASKGYPE